MKKLSKLIKLKNFTNRDKVLIAFVVFYVVVTSAYMFFGGVGFSLDELIIIGLMLALLIVNFPSRFREWFPFALLFLSYEYSRGLMPVLAERVKSNFMIQADHFLFGNIPTVFLQNSFYNPEDPHFYDYVITALYIFHFILPILFAIFLWKKRREQYTKYLLGLVVLTYAAFLTAIIYPAMPPWMAAQNGFIPPVYKVFNNILASLPGNQTFISVYKFMNPDPIASIPSLHAAYPTFVYLHLINAFGERKWAKLAIIYPLIIYVGIVYIGNHYVVDVFLGILYALVAFYATKYFYARKSLKTETVTVKS